MSIGYASLNIGTPDTNIRSVIQRNATPEKLMQVTAHNLAALEKMIHYNSKNNIQLFRISSDLIPFGSSPEAMAAKGKKGRQDGGLHNAHGQHGNQRKDIIVSVDFDVGANYICGTIDAN